MRLDPFGFEDFEKAVKRSRAKYDRTVDKVLTVATNTIKRRVKLRSPVSKRKKKNNGMLKASWKSKKPKEYQNGKYKVGRVESGAPHAHLYEQGHEVYTSPRKKVGKISSAKNKRLGTVRLWAAGVRYHGFAPGHLVLQNTIKEAEVQANRYYKEIEDAVLEPFDELEAAVIDPAFSIDSWG